MKGVAWLALGLAMLAAPAQAEESTARRIYDRCEGCHSPDRNRTGPKLGGLFGRSVGSVRDFDYSAALSVLTFTWDDVTLNRWLENPQAVAPGTKMEFGGIPSASDRRAVIELLHQVLGG